MMKTTLLFSAMLISNLWAFAQTDSTKTLQYSVKNNVATYTIFPSDKYLFIDSRNKIKITTTAKNKKYEVVVTNGSISKINDTMYVVTPTIAGLCMLSIYETDKNSKKKLVQNKEYTVVGYPQLMWNGVKSDSVITRLMFCGGRFYAIDKKFGRIEVESFKMDILDNGVFTTDSTEGNKVSPKMRKYVASIKPGSILYLKDVKYHTLNGKLKVEPIFRVFIGPDEENPGKFMLGAGGE